MTDPSATRPKRPKVIMLGLRGIPNVQGGVEAHVAALSVRLAARGWDVEVIGRSPYLGGGGTKVWRNVAVTSVWAPRSSYLEALVHTMIGVLMAARRAPDILHIHAIGPALMTPLARLLGLRTVVTHHGFDYERQKWGRVARILLRLGEELGMHCAQGRIGVSQLIVDRVRERQGIQASFVPNGVEIHSFPAGTAHLDAFGLKPGRYILSVSRIVPEKRQLDLIRAFERLADPDLKLALVGGAEYASDYVRAVQAAAAATPGVIMTGALTGACLAQVFANAGVFALPSSHEGMPVALLEALGYGLPVVVSDIPANLALGLPAEDYVPLGDIDGLATALHGKLADPRCPEIDRARIATIDGKYDWSRVADATLAVYDRAAAASSEPAHPQNVAQWSVLSDVQAWTSGVSEKSGVVRASQGHR